MEYHGTDKDDVIDQKILGILDWTHLFAEAGNDTITFGSTIAVGGAGNDTFIGTTSYSTVAYWSSAKGVKADLTKGTVEDGLGGIDTLVNIQRVHGSGFNDYLTGNANDNVFSGLGGNDTFVGGGGQDEVAYFFVKSTDAKISYDAVTDTFTVVKNFSNGDRGTDILRGITSITFTGDGSDSNTILKDSFIPVGGFLRRDGSTPFGLPSGAGISQVKEGDFNGDGKIDFYVSTQVGTGTAVAPVYVFLGDGKGNFTDGTTTVFPNAPKLIVGGGRAIAADFNKDGMSDVFQFDFGNDAPPFPGGLNRLFLSSSTTRQLADASNTVNQQAAQNHAGSVGDVNGDGYLDTLANSLDLGNILYINDKTGHFVTRNDLLPKATVQLYNASYPQTNTASGIIDVNGDRWADLILGKWDGNNSTPSTQVLLNDGTGNFASSTPISLPASGLAKEIVLDVKAIDLNGDARPDLMLSVTTGGSGDAYYSTPYIQLLINDGEGRFHDDTAARLPAALQAGYGKGWFVSLSNVDFNHDGHPDILAAAANFAGSSFVLLNRGDGTFYHDWSSVRGGRSIAGDVNGDGATDVITATDQGAYVVLNQLENGHIYKANFGGDNLVGSAGNDKFYGRDGDDFFNGNEGLDTVAYGGNYTNFTIIKTSTGFTLGDKTRAEGTDTLVNIERIRFANADVALDISGNAGQAYRLYQSAFNRTPDKGGLGYQMNALDAGLTLVQVAQNFIDSPEFVKTYGSLNDSQFVTQLYQNVLHRGPDGGGLSYHVGNLGTGMSRAQVLMGFSESPENQAALIGTIQNGIEYLHA